MLSAGKDISTVPDFSDSDSILKLSQFLNRKCSFGGGDEMTTTMNLFRCHAEQVQNKSDLRELVMVLNDFPPLPEMDKEILLRANNNNKPSAVPIHFEPPAAPAAAPAVKSSSPPPPAPNPIQQSQPYHRRQIKFGADVLPMQRRVSLSRFLERRKDRMMASAPYR